MRLIAAVKKLSPPLAVLGVLIGGWYALAYTLDNNFASGDGSALIIPPPHRLFEGLNRATVDQILSATYISASTAFVGLVLALITGLSLGILMNMSRALESALWPWLIALQVTPIIVLKSVARIGPLLCCMKSA